MALPFLPPLPPVEFLPPERLEVTVERENIIERARITAQTSASPAGSITIPIDTVDNLPSVEGGIPELSSPESPLESPRPTTSEPDQPETPVTNGPGLDQLGVLELSSDTQVFDQTRRVVIADGEALMRFQGGVLSADRLLINVDSRIVVAEGNAALVRGQQRLRGDRIEYNLIQETGRVLSASGGFNTAASGSDLDFSQGSVNDEGQVFERPESDRITQTQPVANVTNPGRIQISTGFQTNFGLFQQEDEDLNRPSDTIQLPLSVSGFRQEGKVNRWRFEADEVRLVPDGWSAEAVSITNDPFSPPQFKIRANAIQARAVSPLVDEIVAEKPRYVFEDKVAIPTFRNRILLDRRPRDDGLVTFGFDNNDRGGIFVERTFEPVSSDKLRINFTPEFYLQRAVLDNGLNPFDLDNFGLDVDVRSQIRPGTVLTGEAGFRTANPTDIAEETRAKVNLAQSLGSHTLDVGYNYRTRIFNGTLGFRTVRQSFGAVLRSPAFTLGDTGITASYQAGAQRITADTDRAELLEPVRENNRVTLNRYQTSVSLNRGFSLWRGQPLPATAAEGLRFSPTPVVPFAAVSVGLSGIYSLYSNGDSQEAVTSTLSFNSQFGQFAKDWFDYTALNATYSQAVRGAESPFQFDRIQDTRVLSFGMRQQVYGPFRVGFQTSLSLDNGEAFSTDYSFEWSRRAYGVQLRYNPELELGSVSLQIHDFNWTGGSPAFDLDGDSDSKNDDE